MTAPDKILKLVKLECPSAKVDIERVNANVVFLTITVSDRSYVVRWANGRGLQLWTHQPQSPHDGFGEKPQEMFRQFRPFAARLVALLRPEVVAR